ncbi:MAG TPA: hypothetical protein DDW88_01395 [Treponema sp.]|nr:hypothetical protein [Treponema sp.]
MAIELKKVGIDSCFLQVKNTSFFCQVIDIKENVLEIITNEALPEDEQIYFFYRTDDEYYGIEIKKIHHTRDYTQYYEFQPLQSFIPFVKNKITAYVQREKALEKRKEERFSISLETYSQFGLTNPQQYVLFNTNRYPCFLSNISLHGAHIISMKIPKIASKKFVSLYLHFKSPTETLIQSALVTRIDSKTADFNAYSLHVLEPQAIWKERLEGYIKENDKKEKTE